MYFAPTLYTRSAPAARSYDRGFERFVRDSLHVATQRSVNVEQDDTSWTITLDAPGLTKEDLTIGVEGTVVRIESKAQAKRSLTAAYELPQEIDVAQSEAKVEHGVLTLKLGKLVPVSKVVQIEVK